MKALDYMECEFFNLRSRLQTFDIHQVEGLCRYLSCSSRLCEDWFTVHK